MFSRRKISMLLASTPLIAACTSTGTIDPAQVASLLQTACGIAVPLATITTIINAAVGATVQMIVDLICSSFKASVAQSAKLGAMPLAVGGTHEFFVTVNGKQIPVSATVVAVK